LATFCWQQFTSPGCRPAAGELPGAFPQTDISLAEYAPFWRSPREFFEAVALSTDLTTGTVPRLLRRQAVPMGLGLVAIVSFDAVDLLFVSQLGDLPLAAISFTFPVVWLLSSIIIGFEAGAASCISRAIGSNDNEGARRQTTDTAGLAGIVSLLMCLVGISSIGPLFRLLGATEDVMPFIHDYMGIWYWSAPASAITWTCCSAIRARGNTLLEGKIITLAACINAILDPLFIFGLLGFPRLEIAGAAVATLIANVIVLAGTLSYLHFKLRIFASPFTAISNILDSWKRMLQVGLPAMMTNAVVPIANGIAVAMIAGYGVDAVAGFGVGARVEPLALIAFYALSAVTSPFMGQNYAAKRFERLEQARRVIGRFCIKYGIAIALVMGVVAMPLASVFSETEAIQQVAQNYLWIMAVSYGGYGMVMAMCAAFNGVGYPMPGLAISLARAMIVFLPLAFLGRWLIGVNGIFMASALSNLLLGVAAYLWFGRHVRMHPAGGKPVLD
jgi:putative MATE family efflux protein